MHVPELRPRLPIFSPLGLLHAVYIVGTVGEGKSTLVFGKNILKKARFHFGELTNDSSVRCNDRAKKILNRNRFHV
jgi:ABC-type ATPase involved in cell division